MRCAMYLIPNCEDVKGANLKPTPPCHPPRRGEQPYTRSSLITITIVHTGVGWPGISPSGAGPGRPHRSSVSRLPSLKLRWTLFRPGARAFDGILGGAGNKHGMFSRTQLFEEIVGFQALID
jgi:hypothetical protein